MGDVSVAPDGLSGMAVRFMKGVGPRRAEALARLGIESVRDLLFHFPRAYIDRTNIVPLSSVRVNQDVTIKGVVKARHRRRTRKGMSVVQVEVDDGTGFVWLVWFNQPYMYDKFRRGDLVVATGRVSWFDGPSMVQPEYELSEGEETDVPLLPVYPLTEGLSQRTFRELVKRALELYGERIDEEEMFDREFLKRRGLMGLASAVREMHFPSSAAVLKRARERLAYDELFCIQICMALRRVQRKRLRGISFRVSPALDARIRRLFPFRLTPAQDRAVEEIVRDMQSEEPMRRLLQGDVGSGKTVVAVYAMLVAVANGYQAALMAPTEVLARQHHETIERLLEHSEVRRELLVGGTVGRRELIESISSGEVDIVIGTHALVEGDVEFARLGLVVVDEQHKFGVSHRADLVKKGRYPDMLIMTATPIPRTLAMTYFGDLDVTIMKGFPTGRKRIVTRIVPPSKRRAAYDFIRKEISAGRQAYFVCPLIEDSERVEAVSAKAMYDEVCKAFPGMSVGLLHGRMKPEEKATVMRSFADGELDILVSTVVIEVGIDVPNASVMVIENAERFGLAQLHQLRGRIGRGPHRSYCLLFTKGELGEEARRRLEVIESTSDGFKVAEEDLKMRGPGEILGTMQHGFPRLRVADLQRDVEVLRRARRDAFALVRCRGALERFPRLVQRLRDEFSEKMEFAGIG